MPTFCRHNRFIERCPICSTTLPGNEPAGVPARRARAGSAASSRSRDGAAHRPRREGLRVRREGRAAEDGYRSELVAGLRASVDAERLAQEIAFSSARLAALAVDPQGTYARARDAAAEGDLERATWACFLLAYLCPTASWPQGEDGDPFAAVEAVLDAAPLPAAAGGQVGELLEGVSLGPRSSHRAGSGTQTLRAYADWARRTGGEGGQAAAFGGDPTWAPERRFARLFERLALPGLSRAARYELLVSLGRLGIYDLSADSLQLSASRPGNGEDAATLAAKRVFGIGDPLLLDRRAAALAEAASVPLEGLDLALSNWAGPERATYGFHPAEEPDAGGVAAVLGV
jgi:hypothetical protein